MLTELLLASALNTHWYYDDKITDFTNEHLITATAQSANLDYMTLACDGGELRLSFSYSGHNQNIKLKAHAKVDHHPGIELTGQVYPIGLVAYRKYGNHKTWGNWPNWAQLIEQMQHGQQVKFRLYDQQWGVHDVAFDLTQGKRNISEVLKACEKEGN